MSWRPEKSRSIITGLVLFTLLAVVLSSVVVSSVLNLQSGSTRTYHALVTDGSGLQSGSNVKIAGIDVGTVSDVELAGEDAVRVTFSVDSTHPVYDTTHAEIRYANLIGTRYVALVEPGDAPPGHPMRDGATIPLDRTTPALDLTAIFNGFQPLFDALTPGEVNQLTGSIINIFQGQSATVANLVDQVGTITTNLANRKQVIEAVIKNLASVLTKVNTEGEALGDLIDNFNSVVTDVSGQRELLAQAITAMARFTNDAADLTADSSKAITGDIRGIAEASRTLAANQDAISQMLRESPAALRAIDATMSSGSYVKVYLCTLSLKSSGELNLSLVPGVPAPQPPSGVTLPSGAVGSGARTSEVCR